MSERYGVYVNGEKWYEFNDKKTAEMYMDILADEVTQNDPTASFDVMPLSTSETPET